MSTDKEYYHNKGERDAGDHDYDPPHQGPMFGDDYWNSDMSGRPVTDSDKRADFDAYQKGYSNGKSQRD